MVAAQTGSFLFGTEGETHHDPEELSGLLQKMDVAAGIPIDRERHERMVDRLLGHLRNDDEGRKQFSIDYLAADTDGTSKRYQLTFRLLSDRFHPSGGARSCGSQIRRSICISTRWTSMSKTLKQRPRRSQLERGKFHEAANAARGAMMNTIRYEQKIGQVLRETRRDVSHVDWREAIPNLLAEAMHHIQRRLETEQGIISVPKRAVFLIGVITSFRSRDAEQIVAAYRLIDAIARGG